MKPADFLLPVLAVVALSSLQAAGDALVVPCDQPVKSQKRGICLNEVDAKDFLLQFLFLILIISLGDEQTVRIKTLTYHHV